MLAFFIITNLWLFWGIVLVDILLCSALIHSEKYGFAWTSFLAGFIAFYFLGMFDVAGYFDVVKADPWSLVRGTGLYASFYFAAGLGYATARLVKLLYARRDAYKEEKAKSFGRLDGNPEEQRQKWSDSLYHRGFEDIAYDKATDKATVKVSRYKGRIVAWMAYWPFSMIGWVLGDLLSDLFEVIYRAVSNAYQRLADHIMKGA